MMSVISGHELTNKWNYKDFFSEIFSIFGIKIPYQVSNTQISNFGSLNE